MGGTEHQATFQRAKPDSDTAGYKSYRLGTHRTVAPADTLARVRPFMRDMGITRIANVTGLDNIGIPVVMVCRPNSRSFAVSQGKGLRLEAAKVSGLMETVETYHAEHITLPLKLGSCEDLYRTHRLVDIAELPHTADSLFHSNLPMLWSEGQDLIQDSLVWLPYELVHANYTLPLPPGSGCFTASTNGLASGNHVLEAINYGICEVVERHSTTVWGQLDRAAQDRTRLDLSTVDDPDCCDVLEKFERANIAVAVWETTTDVDIASFVCLIRGRQDESAQPAEGAGCHPTRHVALLRALTEAAQVRMTYIAGSRDDIKPDEYEPYARTKELRDCRVWMDSHPSVRNFHEVPTYESETFEDDINWAKKRLELAGIQRIVVVDLTKQEFQLPVVRVVIPGLKGPEQVFEHYVPSAPAEAIQEDQV